MRIYFKNTSFAAKNICNKSEENAVDYRESLFGNKTGAYSTNFGNTFVNKYNNYNIHGTERADSKYYYTKSNNQNAVKKIIKNDYTEFYNNRTSIESYIAKNSLEYTTKKINIVQVDTFPSSLPEQVILIIG